MKDSSTLKALNRKLEIEFKEAQLHLVRLENILLVRNSVENTLITEINLLKEELCKIRNRNKELYLEGVLNTEGARENQIKSKILLLEKELLIATSESQVAEKRIEDSKMALEALSREREGYLKIEDERETHNLRIKIETTDSN